MKIKYFAIGFITALLISSLSFSGFAVKKYSKSFSDVNEDAWYYLPIMELSEEGLFSGYKDGTFGVGRNITREEVAKLFHLTSLRISKLEDELSKISGEKSSVETKIQKEDDNKENGEKLNDQLVLELVVDFDAPVTLPEKYEIFFEPVNKFQVFYPKNYYWNNTIADTNKSDGYLWQVLFSLDDFSLETEAQAKFMISIVDPSLVKSQSEVLIFVKRNEETSFLVEGRLEDLSDLQKISASFKTVE